MTRGHIRIPDEILARTDLTPLHKMILGVLGRLQGINDTCAPSVGFIAESIGMSERHVQRALRDLAVRREISVRYRRKQTSVYTVAWAKYRNLRQAWAKESERGSRVTKPASKGDKDVTQLYRGISIA